MKDPYTRAFEIRWLGLEIWHRDKGGVDGACGWTFPRLTDKQLRSLKDMAWCEGHDPYFLRCPGKRFNGSRTDAELLYRALVLNVMLTLSMRSAGYTMEHLLRYATYEAILKVHSGDGRGADVFCWQPGYHSNFSEDSTESREQHFLDIIMARAREILADHRPWYRHPKWHVHHWSIRWRVLAWFKLRFFMRCAVCHKRFPRSEYPTSDWSGNSYHTECYGKRAAEVPR